MKLIQSHLHLAHYYWKQIVKTGDLVVDATCGNGHDTLALAHLALNGKTGQVIAIDIQEAAINQTKQLLHTHCQPEEYGSVSFYHGCHSKIAIYLEGKKAKLIVYNLGYLPSSDKTITTNHESTLASVNSALKCLEENGVLSITCYPGHPAGMLEKEALLTWAKTLSKQEWNCCTHEWINRKTAPLLLVVEKRGTSQSH